MSNAAGASASRLNIRALAVPSLAIVLAIAALLMPASSSAGAVNCTPTNYTAGSSSNPSFANWTDASGNLWSPPGGYPGSCSGDTASDFSSQPTTIVVTSAIPNDIAGLNFSCSGCIIDIQTGGSLTLSGPGTLANGATLRLSGGTLTLTPNAALAVDSSSVLDFQGGLINGGGTINNTGALNVSNGVTTVDAVLNNNAGGPGVNVLSGRLQLQGGGTSDIPATLASGGTLEITGSTYTMNSGSSVSGAGTLAISNGSLVIGGVTSPGGFTMSGGTLTGGGFLSIGNSMLWTGGTITGNGGAELAGSATGILSGTNSTMLLDGRNFNNYGSIVYSPTDFYLDINSGATFNTYGTFDIQADGPIQGGGAGNNFNVLPNGVLTKSGGTGLTLIAPDMTNNYTVWVRTGTLELEGSGTHSGVFIVDSAATLVFSGSSNTFTGAVFGNGTVVFAGGFSDVESLYDIAGQTRITSGSVSVDAPMLTTDFAMTGGTLEMFATFEMTGKGTWSGGTIRYSDGTFYVDEGATLTVNPDNVATLDQGYMENDGTLIYEPVAPQLANAVGRRRAALVSPLGHLELRSGGAIATLGDFRMQNDAVITSINLLTAATAATRTAALSARAGHGRKVAHSTRARHKRAAEVLFGPNYIENDGTFEKTAGSGTSEVDPEFDNYGAVTVASGTLQFTSVTTQYQGTTTLGPGAIAAPTYSLEGGTFNGAGTFTGDLHNNAGTVAPGTVNGPGVIAISGAYVQGGGATLDIDLNGPAAGQFDQVQAGTPAMLSGTVNVTLGANYQPANGTTWDAVTYPSETGTFTTENLPTYGPHGSIQSSYTPAAYRLTAVVAPSVADLQLGMTGPATVNAGAPLSYNVTVTNLGTDPTAGTVTVVDTLPAGVTAASGSGSGWTCGAPASGTITCSTTATALANNTLPVLTFAMTAPVNAANVTNSATVSSSIDTNSTNNTASVNTAVGAQADLSISKTGPTGVTAGQNITYTVAVTNLGPSVATGVTVNDPVPANLTFVSNAGGCTTPYPCNVGTLNGNASVTITSTYSTSPAFSGNVTNNAQVTATTPDPNPNNNSVSATTNVGAQADLGITKTGPATIIPGQTITYTIVVTNAGPSPAPGTVVTDATPVGIAFLSNSGACTTAFPCSLGTLASGQSATITSTYSVPPSYSGGAIVNTANVSSSTSDPQSSNNTATATTNVGSSADVGISKSGPATISAGQNIAYTISVANFGPSAANGVVVSDPTPAGLTFVSASGAGCTAFPCNLGTLAAGPPFTITATFNVPANYSGTAITNTASVSSSSTDPNLTNNSASATTTIAAQSDVAIAKTGPASAVRGQQVVYTITVSNAGPLVANNTFVADPTPAGLTFVSLSGAGCSTFPCSVGNLGAGQSVTLTATYSVPANYAGTTITNTANVSSSSPDANAANNSATAVTPISATGVADLAISKSGPAQVSPRETIEYGIFLANAGPSPATNVVVTDPITAGLSFVSNSGACTTPFPCTIASIPAGGFATIVSRYIVTANSGTISNAASVSSSDSDPNSANNTSSVTSRVVATALCPQAPTPNAPANGATVSTPVTFSWNVVPNATSYTVSIVAAAGGTTNLPGITGNSLTQILTNGVYTWIVSAQGNTSCTPAVSSPVTFTVCNAPTAPIAGIVGEATTGQTYELSWTPIEGTTAYEVQESIDSTFQNVTSIVVDGLARSFTKNVQVATGFYYRVRSATNCSGAPGPFSTTAAVVIVPAPGPSAIGPNIAVPFGSTLPVTFPMLVAGQPGTTTTFVATIDKPWLAVTPTSGIVPPEGVILNVSVDPTALPNGTWTGTVIIVYGTTGVSAKIGEDVTPKTSIPVSVSLTTPVTPGSAGAASASAVVIPSVGHLAGFGSQWESDVRIANVTSQAKKVLLTFTQTAAAIGGATATTNAKQTTLTIDAGATTALDDVVRKWYGAGSLGESSNGVLVVQPLDPTGRPDTSSSSAAIASSRTYNISAAGTLGQYIPAVPLANFISRAPGASAVLSLQQIAQNDTYRTNLGLVEGAGKPASVLVSVFNGSGAKVLELPVTLAPGEQRQLNSFLADKNISLTNGHIEVQAVGGEGKVTAYASVIDSRSSDPLLVSGVPIGGAGASRYVIPGAASLDTGASWRTDLRVFNSGSAPQTATLTLYPTGNPTASVSKQVSIEPGEVKALDDVVQSTFGLANTSGALHVTTAAASPLVVTARTYDDTSHGTLGQFVPAVTPPDAVGNGDRSLQLLQMEDSSRYRANIGIAEMSGKPVLVELTVILPDSKVSPRVQIPLAANEFRQFPVITGLGISNAYNVRISARVIDGAGKITAYGSVIDRATQDPTYVPAQ
jgi:uncharacterized repeat protein (TIGR01451 family)